MEGFNNSNTTTTTTTTASSGIIALTLPLDNFATTPVASHNPDILAVCIVDETSRGTNCYYYSTCNWRAVAGGVPDISINDCARMLTSLSGSGVYEQSRQVSISEAIGTFVKEMRPFPSMNDDAGQFYQKTNDGDVDKKGLDATLTITSNDSKRNTWIGFKVDGAMYLRGNGWDDMDIRESVVAVLELAEEQLGCQTVYLCLEKNDPDLANLVRALMYAGFEVVVPGVLPHADPKYLVLGTEF